MLSAATKLGALDSAQVMVRDADGIITFWSQGFVRLLGFTAEQALGQRAASGRGNWSTTVQTVRP